MSTLPQVLSCSQLAEMTGCQESTIEYKARKGLLPGLKFGPSWVFPTEATLQFLNAEALRSAQERAREREEPILIRDITPNPARREPPKLPDLCSFDDSTWAPDDRGFGLS